MTFYLRTKNGEFQYEDKEEAIRAFTAALIHGEKPRLTDDNGEEVGVLSPPDHTNN